MSLLAEHPGKRAVERYWLMYTPVWGAISAVVMMGGFAERWGDLECMIYGVGLMLGAVVPPVLMRPPEERARPLLRTTSVKYGLSVTGLAFALNYSQTPYFYDVLHMHYGFRTELNIQNNPFFLYGVSVAYFSTYAVLCCVAYRFLRRKLGTGPLGATAWFVAPMAMAFLETALNANPFIATLFCYDDIGLMLGFGTLSYGAAFVFALPMWMGIDERPGDDPSAAQVLVWLGAAMYADVLTLDLLRYHVAPLLTDVVPHANGLRDYAGSCLSGG
jgi:cycloeucalenol cycloisomerase